MLKLLKSLAGRREASQPPSGGCVLKPEIGYTPANLNQPPSGGCVLKHLLKLLQKLKQLSQPPSGGCVLKLHCFDAFGFLLASRLRAAVC